MNRSNRNVLGLPYNGELTMNQIRSAYLSKAKVLHPNKAGGSANGFQKLAESYQRLIDKFATRNAIDVTSSNVDYRSDLRDINWDWRPLNVLSRIIRDESLRPFTPPRRERR